MTWLKANWVIVLLTVISLGVIPVAWYFSENMRAGIRDDLQKKVQADVQDITNAKVQYHLIDNSTGNKILEKSMPPNKVYTDWYSQSWQQISSKTGTVSEAALTFNKKDRKPLVADLFPDPQEFIAEAKLREFAAAYIRAHAALLQSINAGEPLAPAMLSELLNDFQASEIERVRNQTGAEPSDAEKVRLAESLRELRIREYQRHGSEISVYAGPYVFFGVPATPPTVKPSAAQCWDWQERYWIHEDICNAIAEVNKDASGTGVADAVVKRIIKIQADPPAFIGAEGQLAGPAATEAGTDKAPVDYARSITGRYSGAGSNNKWYDVRGVTVEVVVSSRRLPELFDALASVNFMSVLDMDLFRVDPIEELKSGYFYGAEDPVVRAVLRVETVWLREWRKDLMPLDVRKALGLVEGIVAEDPGASAPPPPPRPRGNAGGGDDELGGGGRGRRGGGD